MIVNVYFRICRDDLKILDEITLDSKFGVSKDGPS